MLDLSAFAGVMAPCSADNSRRTRPPRAGSCTGLGGNGYGARMAQWRIELTTQDVVALSQGSEITVTAIDEEQELAEDSIEVRVSLLDL
jgi:hypothetical protein